MDFIYIDGFLPNDVVKNSGITIKLIGEITKEPNEIIVITQLGRIVFEGYVCHLVYKKRKLGECHKYILDMPNFPKIKIPKDFLVKELNGIKYTMICLEDKNLDYAMANWLW